MCNDEYKLLDFDDDHLNFVKQLKIYHQIFNISYIIEYNNQLFKNEKV